MHRGTEGPGKARPRKEGVQGAAPHIPLPWQFLMIFGNNLMGLKHRIFGSNKSQESGYDPIVRACLVEKYKTNVCKYIWTTST